MEFLFQLGKNQIRLFDIENNYEPLYIDGKPVQEYQLCHAQDAIPQIIDELAREFNIEAQPDDKFPEKMVYKDIKLIILENSDKLTNTIVEDILESYIEKKIAIKKIIIPMLDKLRLDKDTLVEQYGINYDGINYKYEGEKCIEGSFSLLGYTVTHEMAANTIKELLNK